jgi:hypothetical protein
MGLAGSLGGKQSALYIKAFQHCFPNFLSHYQPAQRDRDGTMLRAYLSQTMVPFIICAADFAVICRIVSIEKVSLTHSLFMSNGELCRGQS